MTVSVVAFIGRNADKARVRQAVEALPGVSSRIVAWCDGKAPGEACLAATREAVKRAQAGEDVLLAGPRALVVPSGVSDIDPEAWCAAWTSMLAARHLAFAFTGPAATVGAAAKASTIRQYQRAEQALTKAVEANVDPEHPYICGRPPYGYRVVDGKLAPQPKQQDAVKMAFHMAQHGATLREIVTALQSNFSKGPDGKSQFWDRVKLKRIWAHVGLYTRGTYQASSGPELHLPTLAFLDEAYGQVPYPSPPSRSAAAMADIPSRAGKGKMEAHASSTRRKSS